MDRPSPAVPSAGKFLLLENDQVAAAEHVDRDHAADVDVVVVEQVGEGDAAGDGAGAVEEVLQDGDVVQEVRVLEHVVQGVLDGHDLDVAVVAQDLEVVERVLYLDDGGHDSGGAARLIGRVGSGGRQLRADRERGEDGRGERSEIGAGTSNHQDASFATPPKLRRPSSCRYRLKLPAQCHFKPTNHPVWPACARGFVTCW